MLSHDDSQAQSQAHGLENHGLENHHLETNGNPAQALRSMASQAAQPVGPQGVQRDVSGAIAPNLTDLQRAIATVLSQAQVEAQSARWPQVIAACELAIARCHQCLDLSDRRPDRPLVSPPLVSPLNDQPVTPSSPQSVASSQAASPAVSPAARLDPVPHSVTVSDKMTLAESAVARYQAEADGLIRQGRLADAVKVFQQAIQRQPKQVALHRQLAAVHVQQQQWAHAIRHYQHALSLSPDNEALKSAIAEAWSYLAEALKQTGEISAAVRAYLKALRYQPRLFTVYNRLRYNLLRYDVPAGDPILVDVVNTCTKILAEQPDLQLAEVTLYYALTQLGKLDAAIAGYRQASDHSTRRQLIQRNYPTPVIDPAAPRRQPDFMIIGAEKCGTTSLYQYLFQHPDVISPVEKEIDFFDMEYKRDIPWYLAHFPAAMPGASFVTGETSANYLYSQVAPARVAENFPDMQLIAIVRHPVDRTISRYNMMVRNGSEKRSFETAITEEMKLIEQAMEKDVIPWHVLNRCRHVGNSLYYYHLQRWLSHFSRHQLLVLRSEELFERPEATLKTLCETLKISPPPAQTYQKHNAGSYGSVSLEMRQHLFAFFAPHTHKLEALLSQSFDWTPRT